MLLVPNHVHLIGGRYFKVFFFFLKDKGDYYSLLFSRIFNTEVWGTGRRVETGGETVE